MRFPITFLVCFLCALFSFRGLAEEPVVRMLVPGFTVTELPVKLSNINNLRFAPDGRLTALGYDGRIHLLQDTDGDGVEDEVTPYWDKPTITIPVGMCWAPEGLYVSSKGKVSLLRDTNRDGIADEEEVIADGWPKTDVGSGGVDATAVTRDAEGNLYFGLLTADYSNAYRVKDGVSRYSTNDIRGTIQKWNVKTRKLETVATGIRVPYTLAFNEAGDLFVTDQEGETWCPNGNPLDELNHIVLGKNYGFPPRHDKWLPDLVSELPVVSFAPQHQSTCGFVFNEPKRKAGFHPGQRLFGPDWWEGDAFVAGQSRGKIWRVKLAKTPNGYIGKEFLIARLSILTTDVAISPSGDLYVSCHSGKPDWGTGPRGEGKLFKISYADPSAPQPMAIWAAGQMEVRVAFDRAVDASITNQLAGSEIEFGDYVSAADRFEVLTPPYKSVKVQQQTPRGKMKIFSARLEDNQQTLALTTSAHPLAVRYAVTIPMVKAKGALGHGSTIDLDYNFDLVQQLPQKGSRNFELVSNYQVNWLLPPQRHAPVSAENPQLTGGDWGRGKNLFFSDKLQCAACHRIRGEGSVAGPDLSNLVSRDVGSILRDIRDPHATINPDYVAFNVFLKDGNDFSGFIRAQEEHSLSVLDITGKETVVARTNLAELRASAISLMPSGLIDGLKENQIRDLLTFLTAETPKRTRDEVNKILASHENISRKADLRALNIVWVANKQDHGAGEHDYPAVQKLWLQLLNAAPGVTATEAWEWPSQEQFRDADVVAFYYWNRTWSKEQLSQLDQFIERGGGVVVLHSACISREPERLAETIGLSSQSGRTKYLHAPINLKVAGTNSITRGLPKQIYFLDEPYWPLIGDTNNVEVLGTVKQDEVDQIQMWTFEKGKGRVFGFVMGHYTWTHEDPIYQILVMRGISWSAREEGFRFRLRD